MPFADIGGYSMHYYLDNFTDPWTEPETTLLMHGNCRHGGFWYPWVPLLAGKFQVLRPDGRGCGESAFPDPDFAPTPEAYVSDLLRLMDALKLDKVHYVGESFGGIAGLQFAYSHPERLSSLTLCNTPCRVLPAGNTANNAGFANRAAAVEALGMQEWSRRTVHVRLDQERASPELSRWYWQEIAKADPRQAGKWGEIGRTRDFTPKLGEIRVPTLLISPGKSILTTIDQQRMMAEMIPHAELVIIEDVGHGIASLEPEKCVQAMLGFLSRLPHQSQ